MCLVSVFHNGCKYQKTHISLAFVVLFILRRIYECLKLCTLYKNHCNIPKLVSYTKWWYGIFQYHTTIWIVVWYWKIPYHHLTSDSEKTNFWYITMRIPWLCLGGICKYWPHSSKLGSNVNLPPAAVGLHWAPISQNIGQYLLIPPRQSQGIVTLWSELGNISYLQWLAKKLAT